MQIWSQDLFQSIFSTGSLFATVKIVPTLPDCVITINDEEVPSGSVEVPIGSILSYKVEKSGYNTASDTFTVIGAQTIGVTLNQLPMHTVAFKTYPTSAGVTLTCSDPTYKQEGATKAIRVPEGTTVTYTVTAPNLDAVEGTTERIYQDYTGENAIEVVMKAKLSVASIPDTATILLNNEPRNNSYFNCTETVFYTVEAPGYKSVGTDAQNRLYFPRVDGFLANTIITVEMERQAYDFSVVLSSAGVTVGPEIHVCVNNGDWQLLESGQRIQVYTDDVVEYYVSYKDKEYGRQIYTIGTESYIANVLVAIESNNVFIDVTPTAATVTVIEKETGVTHVGVGSVSIDVANGKQIEFYASYGGVESEHHLETIEAEYRYSIVLDSRTEEANLVTENQRLLLQPGRYIFICFGAGGSGATGGTARSGTRTSAGGSGGGGGGSGYITKTEVVLSEAKNIDFIIGVGGSNGLDGTETKVNQGTDTLCSAAGGKSPVVLGSPGGDGGSGGGCGGIAGQTSGGAQGQSYVYQGGRAGNGGVGGRNGETVSITSTVVITHVGGTGFYETVGSYAPNAGELPTTNYGNGGYAGKGAFTLLNGIPTTTQLTEFTLQSLYNAVEGGGGGSYSKDPGISKTLTGNWYAGPGGGGGGWLDGETGINTATMISIPGKGGDGAVLYARIGWE